MGLRELVRDVLKLDVEDLSYLYTPGNLGTTLSSLPDIRKPGLHNRIAIFFWHTLQSVNMLGYSRPLPTDHIFFVFSSANQRRALAPIHNEMGEAIMINAKQNDLPLLLAYLFALPFFPLVVHRYLQAKRDQRTAFHYLFDVYWFAYGYYIMLRLVFLRTCPKAVVVANDHVMWLRAFVKAAQDVKIPTIYLQHASVNERFPPLSFDYALLEGIDALHKYVSCGPSQTEVFLVGMPKFDAFANSLNNSVRAHNIGICTNPFDKLNEVKKLCDYLTDSFPNLHFILRPHPGDKRHSHWKEMARSYGWQFSDGRKEGVFQFLQCVDVIIAGDSSIHLEAVLLDVYPIYYAFGGQKRDWYGFHQNGLVEFLPTPEAVQTKVAELQECIPPVRSRSMQYNATVNTKYDGHSAKLSCLLISQIAHGLTPDLEGWKRITSVQDIEAYEPDSLMSIIQFN